MIAGIFGLAAGGSQDFLTLASLLAVLGVGVGGNLPVDSAVFLGESNASWAKLGAHPVSRLCARLTSVSLNCSVNLVVTWTAIREPCKFYVKPAQYILPIRVQIAWPLISNFSCPQNATPGTCRRSENMGWRYLLFTLGGCTLLLWGLRFFLFTLLESPRFLAGKGLDAEAVDVVQRLARYNGQTCNLTVDQLVQAGDMARERYGLAPPSQDQNNHKVFSKSSDYTVDHIKALFKTRKLAWSTSLLISLWGEYMRHYFP